MVELTNLITIDKGFLDVPNIKFNKSNWRDDTVPDDQIDRQQLDFKVEHKVRSSSFEVESPTLKAIKRHLTHD